MSLRNILFTVVGLVVGLIGSTQLPLHAQRSQSEGPPTSDAASATAPKVSLQDALHRPYEFAFGPRTPLREVARRLTADLGGTVVLDLAALDRLELKPDDEVELELKGARLKTGLKLLLDQKRLMYRLVPEDNLMIITDKEGGEDPLDRVWSELNHLHRDVHDIQDMVEVLYDLTGEEGDMEGAPRLRQPTIVEEMPGAPGAEPAPNAGPGTESPPEGGPGAASPSPKSPPKRPRTRL